MKTEHLNLREAMAGVGELEAPESVDIQEPVAAPAKMRQARRWLTGAGLAAALGLAAVAGWRGWQHMQRFVQTDNATVSGDIHQISTRVSGSISEVLVKENQPVVAGQVLARLDQRDFAVGCEQARAAQAQAEAQVVQATAQTARDEAALRHVRLAFERADRLLHESAGAISQQEFDDAKAAFDVAQSTLTASRAVEVAAQARLRVAVANVQEAELQQSYTEITAPGAGRIGRKNVATGNRVQPGQVLFGLVAPEIWVTANFKETQLARLYPGQTAFVELDTFPDRKFTGHVESLSPASGAKFALLPPDNATGNFTKIVQRVPVRIAIDLQPDDELASRIVPGMSALVSVRVRD